MSLFGYKDLDYFFAEKLASVDLKTLANFQISNKYYHNLLDNKFYTNLYIKKYGHLTKLVHKNITKKIYFENENCLKTTNNNNYNESKYFAIKNDRADLLFLLSSMFPYAACTNYYVLIDLSIEKDSINCFRYFFETEAYNTNIDEYFIDASIRHKSNKILKHLFKIGYVKFTASRFYQAFHHYSPKYIELYLSQFSNQKQVNENRTFFPADMLEEIVYQIIYPYDDNASWFSEFNLAFALFTKHLSREEIVAIKELCLSKERFATIKLITAYTSFFGFPNAK